MKDTDKAIAARAAMELRIRKQFRERRANVLKYGTARVPETPALTMTRGAVTRHVNRAAKKAKEQTT